MYIVFFNLPFKNGSLWTDRDYRMFYYLTPYFSDLFKALLIYNAITFSFTMKHKFTQEKFHTYNSDIEIRSYPVTKHAWGESPVQTCWMWSKEIKVNPAHGLVPKQYSIITKLQQWRNVLFLEPNAYILF